MFAVDGCRIQLVPMTEDDADLMVKWRNSKDAREAFFTNQVITPDSHILFMQKRKPHDLVWLVITTAMMTHIPVGMVSLTVDTANYKAEFGRLFVDQYYRHSGYATEIVYTVLYYAFNILKLNYVWLEVKTTNEAAIALYDKIGFEPFGTGSHANGLNLGYKKSKWQSNGRKMFENAIGKDLPIWED